MNQRVVETRLDMVRISEDSASEKKPHPQMEKKEHFLRTPPTLVVLLMNRLRERSDPPVSRTPAGVPNPRWCPKPPPGLQNPIGTWAIPLLASKELGTWWRQKHPFWSVCIHMQKIREMHSATKFQQKRFIILNTFFFLLVCKYWLCGCNLNKKKLMMKMNASTALWGSGVHIICYYFFRTPPQGGCEELEENF